MCVMSWMYKSVNFCIHILLSYTSYSVCLCVVVIPFIRRCQNIPFFHIIMSSWFMRQQIFITTSSFFLLIINSSETIISIRFSISTSCVFISVRILQSYYNNLFWFLFSLTVSKCFHRQFIYKTNHQTRQMTSQTITLSQ